MVEPQRPEQATLALEAGADVCFIQEPGPAFVRMLVEIINRTVANDRLFSSARTARNDAAEARERADVLLNEMKHRIANSLALVVSMAHMQAGALGNVEARHVMDAFADRVHSFAQVHKGLYASMNIGTVALDSYLEGLARELHRNHVHRKSVTRVVFDCIPASVSVDEAISLGVILSEWVSNAARFAYPGPLKGEVRASLHRVGGERAVLTVEDDGIGIVRDAAPQAGLGSQIVGVLAHGLGGWFELKPREQGMVATLHFPLPEPARGSVAKTSNH
jgi:two-component sensor histidine kinase